MLFGTNSYRTNVDAQFMKFKELEMAVSYDSTKLFDRVQEILNSKGHYEPYIELARSIYLSYLTNYECIGSVDVHCDCSIFLTIKLYKINKKIEITVTPSCHIMSMTHEIES